MQTGWSSMLNSLLKNPVCIGNLIPGIALISGDTVINHRLGRKMQGWIVSDITGAASIYRSKPLNDKTLTLTSNAIVTVSLYVF